MRNRHLGLVGLLCLLLAGCEPTQATVDGGSPDAGGMSTVPDANIEPRECSAGAKCNATGGDHGLCKEDECRSCNGAADDGVCAAVYGAGHKCIQGSCEVAECRASTQVADCGADKECVDNKCVAECKKDNDCEQGKDCNAGKCVAKQSAPPGTHVIGSSCGTGKLWCNRGTPSEQRCVQAECCGDAQCAGTETCDDGLCIATLDNCPDHTGDVYHVDPSSPKKGNGTASCPWRSLDTAISRIRENDLNETPIAVEVKGTINTGSEGADAFPLSLTGKTTFRGTETAPMTIVAPADSTALVATYNDTRVRYAIIKQGTKGALGTGVRVDGAAYDTPVRLDHVEIFNFYNGVKVIDGGALQINGGASLHGNEYGLNLQGGRTRVSVPLDLDDSHFDDNAQSGIYVAAGAEIQLNGAERAANGAKTITSKNNKWGLSLHSSDPDNEVVHVSLRENTYQGLAAYGGSALRLRNSYLNDNGDNGFAVYQDEVGTTKDLDLGTADNAGGNHFKRNGGSNICVKAQQGDGEPLRAQGNAFTAFECSVTGILSRSLTCSGGTDIGGLSPTVYTHPCVFDTIILP